MRIGAALSTAADSVLAATDALDRALAALDGAVPHLTMLFHTPDHRPQLQAVADLVWPAVKTGVLLGCTTQAVVGNGREIEEGPALAIWTANLGDAVVEPFEIAGAATPKGPATLGLPTVTEETRAVLMLGEPFSFPNDVLTLLSAARPGGVPVIGGMASGGNRPGMHSLILNGEIRTFGAVGVTLSGPIEILTLVSQGCKPIGSTYTVTEADRNVVRGLAGAKPLEKLRDIFVSLSPEDQERMNRGLHIGVVIDEYATDLGPGDFLIRNVMGAEQDSGAIAVGEVIHVGQTVQFHIRDASAADEDLAGSLGVLELSRTGDPRPLAGALLFTCNGRGMHLFGTPNHDAAALGSTLGGAAPVAGMFCAGEIGPVGGQNFLHGFTASVALFVGDDPGV